MRIFLVRHGESEGNVDKSKYFEKHDSDIELTPKGVDDALNAGLKIISILKGFQENKTYPTDNPTYFNLVHSTYKRASQTANIIAHASMDYIKYRVERSVPSPLCIEREWGSLRDIVSSHLKTEEHFNFYYRPVNGESFCDVYKRAATFHQWLWDTTIYENNIVVAHGEFNKVYLMHLLNWDVEEFEKWKNQKNGEVWLVEDGQLSSLTPLTPSPYKKNK
jgi:broad specificity phosphatase PhoE